jgi:hypothetical protein
MPGKRASPAAIRQFWALVAGGVNPAEASRQIGMSRSWGWRMTKGVLPSKTMAQFEHLERTQPMPKRWEDLSDEGRMMLSFDGGFSLFCGEMLMRASVPWREDAAKRVVEALQDPHRSFIVANEPPGSGKALALDTPLPTPSGWTTMKEVEPGDELLGADGRPCRVIAVSEVFYDHDCYEVRSSDGASVIADAGHLWSVRLDSHRRTKPPYPGKTGPKSSPDRRQLHTTADLVRVRAKRPTIAVAEPLRLPKVRLPIDPYVLGVWLGDGDSRGARFTSADPEIVREVARAGYIVTAQNTPMRFGIAGLGKALRRMDLWGNKHIPPEYLRASHDQRLALLQGLMDTDGHVAKNGQSEFLVTNERLARATLELVRSLGVKASMSEGRATIDGRDCGPKYRVRFWLADAARLSRKAERSRDATRTIDRYLTVTPTGSVPTRCVQVDSAGGLYLAGEGMMVTHNSTLFTMDIPAWLICGGGLEDPIRGRALRIMLGSYGLSVATQYVRRLRNFLESPNPFYDKETHTKADYSVVSTFGRFKPRQNGIPWRETDFIVEQFENIDLSEKESTVFAASRDKGFLGERCELYSWDDLVVSANTRNAEIRESTAEWFADEAETRLEPGGVGMLVGQRLGPDDLYRNRLDVGYVDLNGTKRKKYTHIVYPAHFEDRCDGDHRQQDGEDGCLLDEYRLPWDELEQHRQANPRKYKMLYQQEDVDPAGALIDKTWLTGGVDAEGFTRPGCYDEDRGFLEWPRDTPGLIDYVTVDPAAGGYWGILWWAYQHETRTRWLIKGIRSRAFDGGKLLQFTGHNRELDGLMEEWQKLSVELGHRILCWTIEGNGAFKHLTRYEHFRVWQRKWGVSVVLHKTGINKHDEQRGVTEILPPLYRAGLKRIPRKGEEAFRFAQSFEKELTQYPEGVTWDLVMSDWFGEWNIDRIRMVARFERSDAVDEPVLPPYLARQRKEVAVG